MKAAGTRSRRRTGEGRVLASAAHFALVGAFAAGLRNTLLVQLHRQAFGGAAATSSLYVVYREAGMTFDAVVALDVPSSAAPADVLLQFIATADFETAVLRPLRAQVRRHFMR